MAERVLAHEADAGLRVLLPLELADYRRDYDTDASWRAFDALLARADSIEVAEAGHGGREDAYERCGRRVVDECDVLIALWDGQPALGRGGAAEIVEYARCFGRRLEWIRVASAPR